MTKLRSLRITADDLLALVKRAAARGEITCDGLSPSATVWRRGGHAPGHFAHTGRSPYLDGFLLTVEVEAEAPTEAPGDYLPAIDVVMKEGA